MTLITGTTSRLLDSGDPELPRLRKVSVAEYHQMIELGILAEGEAVELVEGWVFVKMSKGPLHDAVIDRMREALPKFVPSAWRIRVQSAITTSDSEPEPDLVVAIGPAERYLSRHPGPSDIALVVEVAESSLMFDREEKARVYARSMIPQYWVVNLKEMVIEAYTDPSGDVAEPAYGVKTLCHRADSVSIKLGEMGIAQIPVGALLP